MARTAGGKRAPHEGNGPVPSAADRTSVVARCVSLADAAQSSPLIAQYAALKALYPDALLLSRVGDFYEAYGADAEDLAASASILLTSKESGKGRRVAMAGVPHHHLGSYLARLLKQRRVVAIAEQMEPPAPNRLVRREIARVLTPGTVLEDEFLEPERNNYICAVARVNDATGIAAADVSTASATLCVAHDDDELAAELDRLAPAEIIVADDPTALRVRPLVSDECRTTTLGPDEAGRLDRAAMGSLDEMAIADRPAGASALSMLAGYLNHLRLDGDSIAAQVKIRDAGSSMMIDPATRRHLDLVRGSGDDERASLVGVLSRTKTAMGARLLRTWTCAPTLDVVEIRRRQDRIAELVQRPSLRFALQESLAGVGDVQRIAQKIQARRAGPRDAAALRSSLAAAARLRDAIRELREPVWQDAAASLAAARQIDALFEILQRVLVDDPPQTLAEGGAIRADFDGRLRELVDLRSHARERLLELEERTRARTGVRSLRIKYTQAFGYYYEVTRTQAASMPAGFARRQSLVNAERFSDDELARLEADILGARTRQIATERELFDGVVAAIDAERAALLSLAQVVAEVDVVCSLAQVAGERGYVRPTIVEQSVMHVEAGRHPIIEAFGAGAFVPNDVHVGADRRFLCITGPNMGGKSTYLRQTALIAVLAQMGSFVPASRATVGLVDRLFTRIGAGDDLAAGRSTFFVEMAETALILRRCTPRSLLLIDEVGRGTGTTDGLAIAQAVSEYLLGLDHAMPIVLFATHFHELVRLSAAFPIMENLHVAVADESAGPVFSHRLLHGSSSRSYGIAVAKMAGLPDEVVTRAQDIAAEIEGRPGLQTQPLRKRRRQPAPDDGKSQMKLEM